MRLTNIVYFSIKGEGFLHGSDVSGDNSFVQRLGQEGSDEFLFRVSSSAVVYEGDTAIGVFRTDSVSHWHYRPYTSNMTYTARTHELITTELYFFKYLLKKRTQNGFAHCTY